MKFNKIVYLFTFISAAFSLPGSSMTLEKYGLRPVTPDMFEGESQIIRPRLQIISEGLFEAIKNNKIDIISGFLKEGEDINTRITSQFHPYNGFTLLHCAVMLGRLDAMQIILDNGASVNATVQSPGSPFHGLTALHIAIINRDESMAKKLLEYRADADFPINNLSNKFYHGLTPLLLAVINNCECILNAILEYDPEVNYILNNLRHECNGYTALHIAVLNNFVNIVAILLENGADVNMPVMTILEVEEQMLSFSVPAMGAYTALHFAAMTGNNVIAKMLLDNGGDRRPVARDGKKSFQLAFINGHTELGFMLMPTRCFFDEECPLCRSSFALGDNVVILPCGHIIQSDCWDLVNANPATANRCVICRIPTARYQEQIFTISSQEILNKFITD